MFKRTGHGLNLTSIFLICPIPVSMDIYPVCTFNCLYCFGKASVSKKNRTKLNTPKPETLDNFLTKHLAEAPKELNQEEKFVKWYIHNRKAVQIGVVSDPFDFLEHKYGYTYDILKVFSKHHYPIRLSTKGVLYAKNKYLKLFKENKDVWKLGVSLFTKDEETLAKVEKNGFSYNKRLKAIRKAVNNGIDVVIRFGPYIPGINEDYEEIMADLHDAGVKDFQLRNFEKSPFLTNAEKKNYEKLNQISKIDLNKFCKNHMSKERHGELSYTKSVEYTKKFRKIAEKYGMNFYTQNDPARVHGLSENCCAVKEDFILKDYNLCSALFVAKEKGEVHYEDVAKNFNRLLGDIPTANTCFFTESKKLVHLKDLFQNAWNNPKSRRGLCKRFGYHLLPDRIDENGNIVYKIDEKRL